VAPVTSTVTSNATHAAERPSGLPEGPVVVCMKWTARPGADPGLDQHDERSALVSEADRAALELGLRIAEEWGTTVVVVAAGPSGAEAALRDALACGAHHAVRLDLEPSTDSAEVARQLAGVTSGAAVVLCGDHSADRGTGSVPAFLAHRLGVAQALGLVQVDTAGDGGRAAGSPVMIRAVRRLDGGRREVLRVPVPCVLSVEGSVAALRRAPLRAALSARTAPIEVRPAPALAAHAPSAVVTAYRPRARAMPAPAGDAPLDRLRALTDAAAGPARGELVELEPAAAAARILQALRHWGYLPASAPDGSAAG
jgi:electron transfer flavoprotein beta subunit